MKLGLLIPTTPDRKEYLDRLIKEILRQMNELNLTGGVGQLDMVNEESDVCIFINEDLGANRGGKTTGKKRNELMEQAAWAGAKYIAFIDDDDMPGPTYIKRGMEVVSSGLDCGELWGNIYFNGKKDTRPFHHSIEHKQWWENSQGYYRCPNHLNFIKLDLVKDILFPDQNFGEDGQWSVHRVQPSGVLKTMYPIPEVIYHYYNGNPKHEI
jgi:hypothetical protein